MATIQETINAKHVELTKLIAQREVEIGKINAAPKSHGKTQYTRGTGCSDEFWELIKQGGINSTGLDNATKAGKIVKVTVSSVDSPLKTIDSAIKANFDAVRQVVFAQKPATRSKGTGNSHVITKAWFDTHKSDCPAGMQVAWDDASAKITYNLPKKPGVRGSTVSHGALNNIVVAFGGKVKVPKTVPAKSERK